MKEKIFETKINGTSQKMKDKGLVIGNKVLEVRIRRTNLITGTFVTELTFSLSNNDRNVFRPVVEIEVDFDVKISVMLCW